MKVEVTNTIPAVSFESLLDRSLFVHGGNVYIKIEIPTRSGQPYDAIRLDSREAFMFSDTTMVHPVKSIKVDY